MISYLHGKILEQEETSICLLVNNIGYELLCSANTLDDFAIQEQVKAWVYTHVREDQLQLFGFSTKLEKTIFCSLIKVNGIGPKMACQILSGASLQDITNWIDQGDVKALTSLPKVGKKKAEQIILTLKGKLVIDDSQEQAVKLLPLQKEVNSALINLGFKEYDIDQVLPELKDEKSLESAVRRGLQLLSSI